MVVQIPSDALPRRGVNNSGCPDGNRRSRSRGPATCSPACSQPRPAPYSSPTASCWDPSPSGTTRWTHGAGATGPADRLAIRTSLDNHPPLYYQLLRGWIAVGGDGEVWIRFLSTLFAAATVPVSYILGRIVGGGRVGLVVAALVATSPFLSAYAREAREYAMVVCVYAAALACLAGILSQRGGPYLLGSSLAAWLRAGRHVDRERIKSDLLWLGLGAFSVLAAFTSYVATLVPAVAVSILILVICFRSCGRRVLAVNAALVYSVVLLLFVTYPYGLRAMTSTAMTVEGSNSAIENKPLLRAMAEMAPVFSVEHVPPAILLSAFLVAVAVWRWYTDREWRWLAFGLLGAFLAPVLAYGASVVLGIGVYTGRTLLWVMVPFFLLLATGVGAVVRPRVRAALLVAVLAVNVYGWAMEAQVTKPAWDEVYRTLDSRFQQGDAVVFCDWMAHKMVKYHADRDRGYPSAQPHIYGDSGMGAEPLAGTGRLWVIGFDWRREHCTNPSEHHDVAFRHTVEYGQGVPSVQIHDLSRRTPLSRHLPPQRYVFIEAHVPP